VQTVAFLSWLWKHDIVENMTTMTCNVVQSGAWQTVICPSMQWHFYRLINWISNKSTFTQASVWKICMHHANAACDGNFIQHWYYNHALPLTKINSSAFKMTAWLTTIQHISQHEYSAQKWNMHTSRRWSHRTILVTISFEQCSKGWSCWLEHFSH